jgi:hypothetical protein
VRKEAQKSALLREKYPFDNQSIAKISKNFPVFLLA